MIIPENIDIWFKYAQFIKIFNLNTSELSFDPGLLSQIATFSSGKHILPSLEIFSTLTSSNHGVELAAMAVALTPNTKSISLFLQSISDQLFLTSYFEVVYRRAPNLVSLCIYGHLSDMFLRSLQLSLPALQRLTMIRQLHVTPDVVTMDTIKTIALFPNLEGLELRPYGFLGQWEKSLRKELLVASPERHYNIDKRDFFPRLKK